MFCNRCGTPLRAGDRFCPRCGASIDPAQAGTASAGHAGPELRGRSHGGRAVGILIAMLVMVVLLLAAAVWSQRDALSGLFDPEPMPTAGPGQQGAEKVAEEHPATDDAGVPWIDPDPTQPEQDMARALLADAAEEAFELLYGEDAVSRSEAKAAFCNLTAGGYNTALDKAMEINGTTIGTLARWGGCARSRPLMAGNCGYQVVLFYSSTGLRPPLSIEMSSVEVICLLWTGSSWKLDASGQALALWPGLFEEQRASAGLLGAERSGRTAIRFGQETRLIRPVFPKDYDAMPTEVYLAGDGSVVVEFWAFNGTGRTLTLDTLEEISLEEADGTVYFALYGLAIEPLQLAPGQGQLVTVTIPPDELQAPLDKIRNVTCAVWFPY